MSAPPNNSNNKKSGIYGLERRIYNGLSLPDSYIQQRNEKIRLLGYEPDALPAGPLGEFILTVADNGCLSEDFRAARHWAKENDAESYPSLAQRSGWRNDKYANQLLELLKLQSGKDDGSIIDALSSARGDDGNNSRSD